MLQIYNHRRIRVRPKRLWQFVPVLFLLGLILHSLWLPWIGRLLVVSDPIRKADALVVLAGDENERIAHSAELFHQGNAEWFVLTDMRLDRPDSEGAYSAIVRRKAIRAGIPEAQILIPPQTVATTYEEAMALRTFAVERRFHSLIIVTSPYHARRAQWILNQAFRGTEIILLVTPISNHGYQPETWWQSRESRELTAMEYLKLVAHLAGLRHYEQVGPSVKGWLKALGDQAY